MFAVNLFGEGWSTMHRSKFFKKKESFAATTTFLFGALLLSLIIIPSISFSELIEINGRYYNCNYQYRVEQKESSIYLVTETAGQWKLDESDLKAFKPGDTGFYYTNIDTDPPHIITQNKWMFEIKDQDLIQKLKRMKTEDLERASSKEWGDSVNQRVNQDAQWQPLREKVDRQIAEKKTKEEEREREEKAEKMLKEVMEHEKELEEIRAKALVEAEKAKKRPIVAPVYIGN